MPFDRADAAFRRNWLQHHNSEMMRLRGERLDRARARGERIGKLLFWLIMSPLIAATLAALYFTAMLPR